ncbi:MarR family winged helix-turn-helix transcriptional regulator [Streptomyces sp. 142MFCol3.1]|uniref:MarR family winged helix-turn-helix transcriptional regulator n=1 Tax=Streptomyces sp. 142MFCol3.1 TaxID=1172179 RepID=UPI000427FF1F|nr:MarR family transcriptional regulator [Streptomyces sp. 142MFCol3.1]
MAGRIADAVEALVQLWTSSGEMVTPRLSAHQLKALKAVGARSELNLTELADTVGIALPAASRLCDRLEAAGLVQRVPHPHNRRALQLLLTPQGGRLLTEIGERRTLSLSAVLAAMSPVQRAALDEGLRAFHDARRSPGAGCGADE